MNCRYPVWLSMAVMLMVAGCDPPEDRTVLSGVAMGTTWKVLLRDIPSGLSAESVRTALADELERLESELSHWRPDSAVTRFNRLESTELVPISEDLARVIGMALRVCEETSGAFDITVGGLVRHYGFGPARVDEVMPVETLRGLVGCQQLSLKTNAIGAIVLGKTHPKVEIDLSAIAKGYAIDVLAGLLDGRGFGNYLIELGGELRAKGQRAPGQPWRVGLETPNPDAVGEVRRTVELVNQSIATSGNYRLFRPVPGSTNEVASHLMDPRTGRPVSHQVVSVSVIAGTAMEADAWATALFVLGPEAGLPLASDRNLAATMVMKGADGVWLERSTPRFGK